MSDNRLRLAIILALCAVASPFVAATSAGPTVATPTDAQAAPSLRILGADYPRAFFFRASEGQAANPRVDYAAWEATFGRLMGIMGKALDEEVPGREARNPEFFTRFKLAHPDQVVLLHFNGNARDPRWHTDHYFPGHWVYRQATEILSDVPAESGDTTIHVRSTADFKVNAGRYRDGNDDIALFGVTSDGHHDWSHCEQVQLVAVDRRAGTITVHRGCYGTRPIAFKAGDARAAAHQTEGPWGRKSHLLWFYNYSTRCPRDPEGKTAADRLVDDLAGWLGPRGELAAFDGLEFDVMFNTTHGDTDGDGQVDDGVIDGRNEYGLGVIAFARQLRERLGPKRIIQADGALGPEGRASQRAFGVFNGIESEGFPNLQDWAFDDWSGGLNRHAFWNANAFPPAFSYINHKWNQPSPGQPGEQHAPAVPYARHRLAFAAAQFTDSAICFSLLPPADPDGRIGIWDELRGGTLGRAGWLGRPEAPAVHLATRGTDLLAAGSAAQVAGHIAGPVGTRATSAGVVLTARDATAPTLNFALRDLPTSGSELVVEITASAAPSGGYPADAGRFAGCALTTGAEPRAADDTPPRRRQDALPNHAMTWLNAKPFTATFFFHDVTAATANIAFTVEGAAPVTLSSVHVYAGPDVVYRVFEHGLVLANPSHHPVTLDPTALTPGRRYRRLQGATTQDPQANNGQPVEGPITLGERDALFLLRVE